jgi:hypothetical protein
VVSRRPGLRGLRGLGLENPVHGRRALGERGPLRLRALLVSVLSRDVRTRVYVQMCMPAL